MEEQNQQEPTREKLKPIQSNLIRKLVISLLVIALLYLVGAILKFDVRIITHNQSYCAEKHWANEVEFLDKFINVDCRTLSSDTDYYLRNQKYRLDGGYPVSTEIDYCEYIHQQQARINKQIEIDCKRPPLFRQD